MSANPIICFLMSDCFIRMFNAGYSDGKRPSFTVGVAGRAFTRKTLDAVLTDAAVWCEKHPNPMGPYR